MKIFLSLTPRKDSAPDKKNRTDLLRYFLPLISRCHSEEEENAAGKKKNMLKKNNVLGLFFKVKAIGSLMWQKS